MGDQDLKHGISPGPPSESHRHSVALSELAQGRTSTTIAEPSTEPTLDPARPRAWHTVLIARSGKVYRQLLGLKPFTGSYFKIFDSLESGIERPVACAGVIFAIAAGVSLPIIGVIFGKLISTFPPSQDELRTRITQLLAVATAYFAVTALYTVAFGLTSEKISLRLRQRLLRSLLYLDQSYLDTHEVDVHSMLTEKVDLITNGSSEKIGVFIQSMSYFVAAFIVAFILSPKLAGILLSAVLPTMALVVSFTSKKISKASARAEEHRGVANGLVESALGAVKVVQAFAMMGEICRNHSIEAKCISAATVRTAVYSAVQLGSIYAVAYAINGLAFYIGSQMAAEDPKGGSAGTVFAVVLLILDSSFVVTQFAPYLDIFAKAAAARESMHEIFEVSEASASPEDRALSIDRISLRGLPIDVEDVSFAYPARPGIKALDQMTLSIRPGALTAIVGTSGGGKSTLISLLTGFYPFDGKIYIGEHELRNLDIETVRSQVAVVEQEPALFAATIFDNVTSAISDENIGDQELVLRCEEALKAASVDFLNELPKGMFTHIGSDIQLSGGQKQRICLARALIRRPAILILDEPTSALDARSEASIVDSVRRATMSGVTVIMIAHRLSTVLDADEIVLFSEGKVVEQGTPNELSIEGTIFRGLLDAQMTDLPGTKGSWNYGKESEMKEKSETGQRLGLGRDTRMVDDSVPFVAPSPDSSSWNALTGCFKVAMPDWPWILLGLTASIISGALVPAEAYIFGALVQLLNTSGTEHNFLHRAYFFCLLFFILGCIALVSRVCGGTAFGIASTRTITRIQSDLLRHLLSLDMEWFGKGGRSVHDLMSAFTKDAGDLSTLSGQALGTIFSTITSVFGGIILAHVVAWKIAVVLLAAVPIMLLSGFLRLWVLAKGDTRRRTAYKEATSIAAEACRYRHTVSVFSLQKSVLKRYAEALVEPQRQGLRFTVCSNVLLALAFSLTYFIYALAYWWGSREVGGGLYNQQEFFTAMTAMLFSAQYAGQLFSLSPELARARAAAISIFTLMSYSPLILLQHDSPDKIGTMDSNCSSPADSLILTPRKDNSKIYFDGVSFSYDTQASRSVLREVTFSAAAGQTMALVGPSGAGKSSTIGLIERFYDPDSGIIYVDGQDIREMSVARLRNSIGLVSQEPDLLPGSIAYNIRLGKADAQIVTDDDIQRVCRDCGLDDFVKSLPDGYQTECGSSGRVQLSGGQRQRVALARALIRNPSILLLDEPTSALDAHSERQVQDAVQKVSGDLTTIIVAHRLASIKHVDCIYVFDEGRIVESGTHQELMSLGGLYASMAKAQSLA